MSDDDLVQKTLAAIDEAHDARRDAHIRDALRGSAESRVIRRRTWRTRAIVMVALASAAAAALITWGVMRATAPEEPFAFGDGISSVTPDANITRDARGRVIEITSAPRRADGKPDGERLIFRGGRLARVESWKDGALDGMSVDFDQRGFVSALRQWRGGREAGPWLELDESGRVHDSGQR